MTGGGGQTTEWVYGVTTTDSGLSSNDIVGLTRWPDPSTGASSSGQQDTVTVNALGQTKTAQDRNGNIHTLSYDVLGRVTSDAVTTLGSGVDGSVRRVETAYDTQGNAYLLTTYDAASGGSIVTQVQRAYNGLGQLITEYQAHGGAVNTSTSPKVQYAYSTLDSSNKSRLTTMTYPSGFALTYNYASGLNSDISRLTSISDSSGTLESYDYLGMGAVVRRGHSQPGVDLTYIGTGTGAGGDKYLGLDSFGRVVDQNWDKSGTATDRFSYTYDRDSNRLTKGNSVNTAFNEVYTYDSLNQLSSFNRGSGSHTQSWDYDALGNWDSVTTDAATQTSTANKQNEITAVSGATTPTYDNNGNMTTDETGKQYVYDAWNRIKIVKNSGGTTLKTYSDDGLNRRVAETASGTTIDLYYSAGWQVLEEAVSGTTKSRYVWSPVYVDALILRDRDADGSSGNGLEERLWVQQDANFNVTALINGSGTVVERYAYDSFGKVTYMNASWTTIGSSAYGWQYLHQGGRLDASSGLYYFRNRDYSPSLGRWVTIDPLHYIANNQNLYGAYFNSPNIFNDPSGLEPPAVIPQVELPAKPGVRPINPVPRVGMRPADRAVGPIFFGVAVEQMVESTGVGAAIGDWIGGRLYPLPDGSDLPFLKWNPGRSWGRLLDPPINQTVEPPLAKPILRPDPPPKLKTITSLEPKPIQVPQQMPNTINDPKSACFVAGTLLLTPGGLRAIEEFQVGDPVLSRDQWNIGEETSVEYVEEVFVTTALAYYINVGGRTIGTTALHPFWVQGKGWTAAHELTSGDVLIGHDRQPIAVDAVRSTEDLVTVYNFRVSNHHTYFVGGNEWGFSVWAHNACLYHYTDRDGYNAIRAGSGRGMVTFEASTPSKSGNPTAVYFTPVPPELLKSVGIKKLGLINSKIEYFFLVDVPDDRIRQLPGPVGLIIKFVVGDLTVPRSSILRQGETGW